MLDREFLSPVARAEKPGYTVAFGGAAISRLDGPRARACRAVAALAAKAGMS
jgi:hypothetical protein